MQVGKDHWLQRVRRMPSPNRDQRPDPGDISLVVIHGISLPPGRFGGGYIEALFQNDLDVAAHPSFTDLEGVRVSAHVLVDRRGRTTQFVAFHERAWHAGESRWRGRRNCNDFAVGIELEGEDERAYTRAQYARLVEVLCALLERYPLLSPDAVVGHQEVAPGRKTDPGVAFEWRRLLASLQEKRLATQRSVS